MARVAKPIRRFRDDDGMTILEVAIAAAVLLFVISALLGLLGVSTMMTAKAKSQTVAINVANSVVEKIRTESFPLLTQSKVDSITALSSGQIGNVTTVVTGELEPKWLVGLDPDTDPISYYKLTINVHASGVGKPVDFTTSTFIRRWRMESDPAMVKPSVAFTPITPAQSEIVWGDKLVGATASSNVPAVDLKSLGVYGRGTLIVETTSTQQAMDVNGTWHTTDWQDGGVALTAEARDPGQVAIISRTVVIDNAPPSNPPTPTLEAVTTTNTVVWRWDSIYDGQDPVADYDFKTWKQSPTSGAFVLADTRIHTPIVQSGIQRFMIVTTSFSRYYISLRARSPRETYLGYTWPTPGPTGTSGVYISRPGANNGSTCNIINAGKANAKATFKVSLMCDPPTFANSSSDGVYHWQYKYGSQPWVKFVTDYVSTNPYVSGTITAPVNGKISDNPIQFRCLVNITPAGTSTPVYVPSSMVTFRGTGVGLAPQTLNTWAKWETNVVHAHTINWSSWSL